VVDVAEEIGEGAGVVVQFEVGLVEDLLGEGLGDVLGYLGTAVAVEDREEVDVGLEFDVYFGVLHGAPPALHLAGGEGEASALDCFDLFGEDGFFEVV
jgi:hypothetical protein